MNVSCGCVISRGFFDKRYISGLVCEISIAGAGPANRLYRVLRNYCVLFCWHMYSFSVGTDAMNSGSLVTL